MENNGLTETGTQEVHLVLNDPLKWKELSHKVQSYTDDDGVDSIYIELGTDIDFNETEFNIGVTGKNINDFRIYNAKKKIYFNGNNNTLKNLKFSKISGGQIVFQLMGLENLNICNVICGSGHNASIISISPNGQISNCNFSFYLLNPDLNFKCIRGENNNTSMYLSTINIGGISSSTNSFLDISEICNCHINFDKFKTKPYTFSTINYLLFGSYNSSLDTCHFSGDIIPILSNEGRLFLSSDAITFYSCFIDLNFIFGINSDIKKEIQFNQSKFKEINLIKKPGDNANFIYTTNETPEIHLLSDGDLMESEKVSATGFPYIRV